VACEDSLSTADFKRPHGIARGAAPPAPAAASPAAGAGLSNEVFDPSDQSGYGEESPMPGREKEYYARKAEAAKPAAETALPPARGKAPHIDSDRRDRSPGLQNNFFDTSTADFKRPHGK